MGLSLKAQQQYEEDADTLFEPITQITHQRALDLFYQLQTCVPRAMRHQKVNLVLCANAAQITYDIEELDKVIQRDGHIVEGSNGAPKQNPALVAKATLLTKLSDLCGRIRVNPPKASQAMQDKYALEEQARTAVEKKGGVKAAKNKPAAVLAN